MGAPVSDAKQQEKPSSPSHMRPYEYTENDDNTSPTRRTYTPGGFRYDEDPVAKAKRESESGQLSPNSQARRATGYAFNYAPGDDDALRNQAEKLKAGELSPKSKEKTPKSIDLTAPLKSSKSYSPSNGEKPSELAGIYKPHNESLGDPHSAAFLEKEREDSKVPIVPAVAPDAKKKRVKILVLISSLDPKTKRIDTSNPTAIVEHSTGILTENGIETKYGLLSPEKSTLQILSSNGNTETYQGAKDAKTGNIHFASGVSNPATGQLDNSLGQIVCVAPQDKAVIDVTGITGKLDAQGNVDIANGAIERSRGLLDLNNDTIDTKYGIIDLKTSEIKLIDPKTGKPTSKKAKYDKTTGLFTIAGAVDAKGKYDPNLHQVVALGSQIDPVVEVTSVIGKVDKKGILDSKTSTIENTTGQVNGNRIDTKYGQLDLVKHTITLSDGKAKDFKVDPVTGQIIIKNVVNPKNPGKAEKDYAQILSLKIVNRRLDPAGKVVNSADNKDVVVDKTNKIWIAGSKDPKTNEPTYYTSSQMDPKTGTITIVYGLFNPKNNEIEKQTKLLPNVCVANSDGALYTSTGDVDEATQEPIFAASIIEPDTKNVVTKVSRVRPQTGEVVLVRVDYPKAQVPAALTQEKTTPVKQGDAKSAHQAKQVTPPKVPAASSKASTPTTAASTVTPKQPSPPVVPPPKQSSPPKSVPAQVATKAAAAAEKPASKPVAIVPQKSAIIEIVTIIGTAGPDGKVDMSKAQLERSQGILNVQNGTIQTKYGLINPATKELTVTDKTGKSTTTPITCDPSGQIIIAGGVDSKGKPDNNLRHIINLGSEVESPIVEVTAISGKFDAKKGIIEPKTAVVDVTQGQFDPDKNTVTTSYGELDIPSSTITFKHPKSGKLEKKDVKFDPTTGQVILRNELNPKNNKLDKDYGRIISLRIIHRKIDPKTGKVTTPTVSGKDIIVDPQTNQLWVPESKDPITKETIYASTHVDPKGYIITIYGYLDPKTKQIKKNTSVESNITKTDESGQLYVASGDVDEAGEPLFVASQLDVETNEVYTKVAKVDPKTGKLILIKIILITKKDEHGVPKEIPASAIERDPSSGVIRNVFNKTVYVYNMVDPITGEIIQVDPNDP